MADWVSWDRVRVVECGGGMGPVNSFQAAPDLDRIKFSLGPQLLLLRLPDSRHTHTHTRLPACLRACLPACRSVLSRLAPVRAAFPVLADLQDTTSGVVKPMTSGEPRAVQGRRRGRGRAGAGKARRADSNGTFRHSSCRKNGSGEKLRMRVLEAPGKVFWCSPNPNFMRIHGKPTTDLDNTQLLLLALVLVPPALMLLLPTVHGCLAVAGAIAATDLTQPLPGLEGGGRQLPLEWLGAQGWLHVPLVVRRGLGALVPALCSAYYAGGWLGMGRGREEALAGRREDGNEALII